MAPKGKGVKRARASSGSFPSRDDLRTLAVIFEFSQIKVDTTAASKKLGITKKAWSARWIRVKKRLAEVQLDSDGTPEDEDEENHEDTAGEKSDDNMDLEEQDDSAV